MNITISLFNIYKESHHGRLNPDPQREWSKKIQSTVAAYPGFPHHHQRPPMHFSLTTGIESVVATTTA